MAAGDFNTEAAAVAELSAPIEVDSSKLYVHNGTVINLQDFQPTPRRKRGRTTHFTAESLAEYTKAHQEAGTAAYVDEEAWTVTVVLNGPSDAPGWSDHVAHLAMRETPEWKYWLTRDDKMMRQNDFALHIEGGLKEISKPVAADMLELAQQFQATINTTFKSGKRLDDGSRQLEYVEDVSAYAGKTGQITIPKELELTLAPFEGSAAYKLRAWFRFRINNGTLELGYRIDRARDAQKQAFEDVVAEFQKATLLKTLYAGKPGS